MDSNNKAALLVMDMQDAILANLPDSAPVIRNVQRALAEARSIQMPVIYVVVGFREGAPEISPGNKFFAAGRARFTMTSPEEFMMIHPDVAPREADVVVTKRRFSAFTGSDLEVVLRAMGISHLTLTGVSTSGVVLSTTREAADRDYRLTILSDACADGDEEVHRVLMTKVFPRQADVMPVEDWRP